MIHHLVTRYGTLALACIVIAQLAFVVTARLPEVPQ